MKYFYSLLIMLFPVWLCAQQVINSFDAQLDSTFWEFDASDNHDPAKGWINYPLETSEVYQGTGAMKVEYSVHDIESWGGYSAIAYAAPDDQLLDWSSYDSLSIWYNNLTAQDLAGRVHLRINLMDGSEFNTPPYPTDRNDMEYWYSYNEILDDSPGWNQIKIPLKGAVGYPGSNINDQFYITDWAGNFGNNTLDANKIRGYVFEFSISGSGADEVSSGVILLDNMTLVGSKNLLTENNGFESDLAGWATDDAGDGATVNVITDAAAFKGNKYLEMMVEDNNWAVTYISKDLAVSDKQIFEFSAVIRDFSTSATGGNYAALKIEARDTDGTVLGESEEFQEVTDSWQKFTTQYIVPVGADSMRLILSANKASGNGIAATYGFDEVELVAKGVLDDVAPQAPTGVGGTPNVTNYFNNVIWVDVPGEVGETYTVYASENPITDINVPGVEAIASGVAEGTQIIVHYLKYPLQEAQVTYYYAVVAVDKAGNVSEAGIGSAGITNTAQNTAVISFGQPENFVADGDFSEWDNAGIIPFEMSPEEDYVVTGAIDNSNDLSTTVYLAIDDNYLYIAAEVIDDVYDFDASGNWWEQDALEFFIGLYDSRSGKHSTFQGEDEPDYQIIIKEDELRRGSTQLYESGGANFYFEGLNPDYLFEAKISLDTLRNTTDRLFHPARGMKIPFDLYFHDKDGGSANNTLSLSPQNTDAASTNPREWTYTFIGDTNHAVSAIDERFDFYAKEFNLKQNYPNPFNPETYIEYSLEKAVDVKINIYNAAGQRVESLVNTKQTAGSYRLKFDGSKYASGVYFYRIQAGDFVKTRKMLLVK